ncbi:unnamed protein product [Acanthoscelides obtectus]|nr:unnamed protein product [Acanthoscelides obtectus]CAK1629115.1 Nucleic acid dioxygenase ALKBH1 [Acanthoscelides obtectus]
MFKQYFKYYKSRNPAPDLRSVIDLEKAGCEKSVRKVPLPAESPFPSIWGLKPSTDWQVWEIVDKPGLIIIRNPFTSIGQRFWVVQCLRDYSKKPNKSNIDGLIDLDGWWEKAQCNKETAEKLRWITLGFHHNWDTKIYSDMEKDEFPCDLKGMIEHVSKVFGYDTFQAEAAIINYYHMNSTLSGHTDHSEINLEAPLFSVSLGQSAIFLLGGHTIDEKPVAVLLRSGDIVIMSKESRLSYHAVPRILKADSEPWNSNTETIASPARDIQWDLFEEYLKSSRININVRQVLQPQQSCLSDVI